jgi:hypothetical protein
MKHKTKDHEKKPQMKGWAVLELEGEILRWESSVTQKRPDETLWVLGINRPAIGLTALGTPGRQPQDHGRHGFQKKIPASSASEW